eukprot:2960745-Lingulodinium_polyedra.AAC.1
MNHAGRECRPFILEKAYHQVKSELCYAGQVQWQVPRNGTQGQGDSLPAAVQARLTGRGVLGRVHSAPAGRGQRSGGCACNGRQ